MLKLVRSGITLTESISFIDRYGVLGLDQLDKLIASHNIYNNVMLLNLSDMLSVSALYPYKGWSSIYRKWITNIKNNIKNEVNNINTKITLFDKMKNNLRKEDTLFKLFKDRACR